MDTIEKIMICIIGGLITGGGYKVLWDFFGLDFRDVAAVIVCLVAPLLGLFFLALKAKDIKNYPQNKKAS